MVFASEKPSDECWWIVKPKHGVSEADDTREGIKVGDAIRLEHQITRKNLHSHPHNEFKSPITRQQEVTAYGSFGTGDANDNWLIELLEGDELRQGARIILRHKSTDFVLHSHGGHSHKEFTDGEQEVTCNPRGDDNDIWIVAEINIAPERSVQPVVSIGAEGRFGPLNFYSVDEFGKWFQEQETLWNWLNSGTGYGNLVNLRDQHFNGIRSNLQEALTNRDSTESKRYIDNVQSAALSVFRDSKWPVSGETITSFLGDIRGKTSPRVSAAAFACLIGQDVIPGRETLEGAFLAYAYRNGLSGVAASEVAAFDEIKNRANHDVALIRGERDELNKAGAEQLRAFSEKAATLSADFKAEVAKLISESTEKLTGQVTSWHQAQHAAEKRVADFEETLRNKIAVEESVSYWKRKGERNFVLACIFALAGGAAGFGAFYYISDLAGLLLSVDRLGVHDYWRIAVLVFTVTVAIWLVRLVVQLTFSNLHQWTDARERQTMIQTYLALKKDGYLPKGKDVSLILGVLFRPGDSGLLKGEKGPSTPAEMLVRRFDSEEPS